MWDTQMGWVPWAERLHTLVQRTAFEEAYILKEKVDVDVGKDAV